MPERYADESSLFNTTCSSPFVLSSIRPSAMTLAGIEWNTWPTLDRNQWQGLDRNGRLPWGGIRIHSATGGF